MNENARHGALKALIPTQYLPGALPGTAQYTVPAGAGATVVEVLSILACNTTGAASSFTLHVVPSGGTAVNGNRVWTAYPVAANDTVGASMVEQVILALAAGDAIFAFAPAGSTITLSVYGKEYM